MWSIDLIENTLKVPKSAINDLWKWCQKTGEETWYDKDEILYNGCLTFNSDHMEHQDYLYNEDVQKILNKHKAKGRVLWGSMDGDNAGQFWGYEFDGKGKMTELVGKVVWESK